MTSPATKASLEGTARRAATPRSKPSGKTLATIDALRGPAGFGPPPPQRPVANTPAVRPIASEPLTHTERAEQMAAESAALLRRLPKTKDSRGQPR